MFGDLFTAWNGAFNVFVYGYQLECWISRLEDNFGLFPISVIAMASPFCDLRISP